MVKDKRLKRNDIDSSSEEETAQEKRVRLAKEYIAELEEQGTWAGYVCVLFYALCMQKI